MTKSALRGLFLAAFAAALFVRLADLGRRPMHHDEANQAIKFGTLLERGEYRYDKADHHGPTLYYLTLPAARLRAQGTLADLDETTLRAVPAVFGAAVLLVLLLFGPGLGPGARTAAALLAALSPALVYYSRFYIQESLFLFFTAGFLASVWRYLRRTSAGWAFLAGLFAGLMLATKETAVVVFASAALAFGLTLVAQRIGRRPGEAPFLSRIAFAHVVLAALAAAAVSALFFSSFLRDPQGIVDAIAAFKPYFAKGTSSGPHTHPFFYYLGLLAYSKSGGLVWSEGLILLLGLAGSGIALFRPRKVAPFAELGRAADYSLGVFLASYTILATLAFSLLPYKTPWNVLPFHFGWVLLAGIGAASIVRAMPFAWLKALLLVLLAAGLGQLGLQTYRANFRYEADPRNPYVYAQTSSDFLKLVRRVDEMRKVHPDGKRMLIKVIAGPSELWPLPWSLRGYPRVGYWTDAAAAGDLSGAALLIVSQDQAPAVERALGDAAVAEHYGLRPNVLLTLFVPRGLWTRYLDSRGASR
jgi:uncharacterized protein (TIGR03663 family)